MPTSSKDFLRRTFAPSISTAVILLIAAGPAPAAPPLLLDVQPADGLIDEPLRIVVSGLEPGQPIIVRGSTKDADGRLWQAWGGFTADGRGETDLRKQAPEQGTYRGADPDGLVRSMDVPGADHARSRFAWSGSEPLTLEFFVEAGGQQRRTVSVVRRFRRADAVREEIRTGSLFGAFFKPAGPGPFPGVLVLGGPEGGLGSEDEAALLSSHGFAVLTLAYFGAKELPEALEEIPLETFLRGIDELLARKEVRPGAVAIVGTSKGAEAALLVAARDDRVRAVVAIAPSSVVWSCLCAAPDRSSWSFGGKPVPFVAAGSDPLYRPPAGFPVEPAINYLWRMRDVPAAAAIDVERIAGPLLLVSGTDDRLWPSGRMAAAILARRKAKKAGFEDRNLSYDGAGHLIGFPGLPAGSTLVAGGRLRTGGSPEANAAASANAWPQVIRFLDTSLRSAPPRPSRPPR